MKAAEKPGVFNFYAAVLDDRQSCLFRSLGCLVVADTQLKPEHFGPNSYSLVRNRRNICGTTKDVYDLDLFPSCFSFCQGCIYAFA